MNIKKSIKKRITKVKTLFPTKSDFKSYSQAGEDKCIEFIFTNKSIIGDKKFSYLDIGSNDPIVGNNTYYFYKKGGRGVLVEPNLNWVKKTKTKRSEDVFINAGIAFDDTTEADYYTFGWAHCLNTFSKEQADYVVSLGHKLDKTTKIKLIKINDVLEKYFKTEAPDIVSIDVEGLELPILNTLNFEKYRPILFCIESNKKNYKYGSEHKIINFMENLNYAYVADTAVNMIFLDKKYLKPI